VACNLIFASAAIASDCTIGGHILGGSAADMKAAGYLERGSPDIVKIPGAKHYRCLMVEGSSPGFREYIALKDGLVVAVVREYQDAKIGGIYQQLEDRYGAPRRDSLGAIADSAFSPMIDVASFTSAAHWRDAACGLQIDYFERATNSRGPFGITTAGATAATIWTASKP
jgi:hypothetical protein